LIKNNSISKKIADILAAPLIESGNLFDQHECLGFINKVNVN